MVVQYMCENGRVRVQRSRRPPHELECLVSFHLLVQVERNAVDDLRSAYKQRRVHSHQYRDAVKVHINTERSTRPSYPIIAIMAALEADAPNGSICQP